MANTATEGFILCKNATVDRHMIAYYGKEGGRSDEKVGSTSKFHCRFVDDDINGECGGGDSRNQEDKKNRAI
ncbi:hypothetical protein RvY_05733 [Ramazzottius varieornatus]|uniref:Uncharacterized protein n=1 Tax=Ramazzottius varieornatus TaxID=947166 RepID=A0A1D1UZN9_RAMVA|nr:hypothetical protein RvY_05733 [Ramazzottius varieornatus]